MLEAFFDPITHEVMDPVKNVSLFDRKNALELVGRNQEWPYYKLYALGSGSDYSPFFQHLGISSFNLGFGGEGNGGEYHTMYDSYELFKRFKDPDFDYSVVLVKVAGRIGMRLANANLLPFEFKHFVNIVNEYMDELLRLADELREQTEKENKLINEGYYAIASDPNKKFVVPDPKAPVPHFNFAPLQNAIAQLDQQAEAYTKVAAAVNVGDSEIAEVNKLLMSMERVLIREQGLPGRPWFKHHIYAPGFYTGYGVKTLPGVREALEQRNFAAVEEQVEILAAVLMKLSVQIEQATSMINTTH
jgi:N-acetylated-alpha-linked acidic dipeptidase